MNLTLAKAAIAGVTDIHFEDADGYCQRFHRQVDEAVFGDDYAIYMEPSAKETAQEFLDPGLTHYIHDEPGHRYEAWRGDDIPAPQPGDVLFKEHGSGSFGHVGIFVDTVPAGVPGHNLGDKLVAENSSTGIGRIAGAKGYRTLSQWGHIDVLVRFPDPHLMPRLIAAKYAGDHWIYRALKSGQWDGEVQRWTVNQSDLGGFFGLLGAVVRQPIRDAAAALGWQVAGISNQMTDAHDPRMYVFFKDV